MASCSIAARHCVGQYRIDTDTFTRPFHRRSAGQRPDRFFDRRVGTRRIGSGRHSGAAAHIDDRSSADQMGMARAHNRRVAIGPDSQPAVTSASATSSSEPSATSCALLTRMSTVPNSVHRHRNAPLDVRRVASRRRRRGSPRSPAFVISSRTETSLLSVRPITMTEAPADASASATPRPRPARRRSRLRSCRPAALFELHRLRSHRTRTGRR